jgi:pimeloyl-ACP methyl ester carboxylesterase
MKLRSSLLSVLVVVLVVAAAVAGIAVHARAAHAAASPCAGQPMTGSLGGAQYKIEVPANWNGTLFLYSHGYRFPGPNPGQDAGDPITAAAILSQGYALAGSGYSTTGWALQQAFHDQIALLDFFGATCGQPSRTIAWGHSLGGIITAGLVQLNPGRFAAALPMCGVVAGGVGTWNQALDSSFVFSTLLAGGTLPIVNLPQNPAALNADLSQALGVLSTAQSTAQGRARIALAAAMADIPGWFTPLSPEPDSADVDTQVANQIAWEKQPDLAFAYFGRADLELRAGGNPSWNSGVDYKVQLAHSVDRDEVIALYQKAGLDLQADLDTLNNAPRIAANTSSVDYLSQYVTFDGDLGSTPVLTMHTTGDGLVANEDERSYSHVVDQAGDPTMLRQIYVHRAGHCSFTPAETLTAVNTLLHRIATGKWSNVNDVNGLNSAASALGPSLNVFAVGNDTVQVDPAFINFQPTLFLRPFTAFDQ